MWPGWGGRHEQLAVDDLVATAIGRERPNFVGSPVVRGLRHAHSLLGSARGMQGDTAQDEQSSVVTRYQIIAHDTPIMHISYHANLDRRLCPAACSHARCRAETRRDPEGQRTPRANYSRHRRTPGSVSRLPARRCGDWRASPGIESREKSYDPPTGR